MFNNKIRNPQSAIRNPTVSPARLAAFEILMRIEREKAFSSVLLPLYAENLSDLDRALCHEITLGTLRQQNLLDFLITHYSGKKLEKLDLAVKIALRIGFYQLRFLNRVPVRAAVNESVNLVQIAGKLSATSFVNAVLRQSEREPLQDFAVQNDAQGLSLEFSHPQWLIEKWIADYDLSETRKLVNVNNLQPATAFRLTDLNDTETLEQLEKADLFLTKSKIAPHGWRVASSNLVRELAAEGKIYLQDEASQLVAEICDVQPNESFFDVCAAPGSKTTLISSLIQNNPQSAISNPQLFVAGDFTNSRLKILRQTIGKYARRNIQLMRYDAAKNLPFADAVFDCVLIDAPCSGTGTIRHNPEIRWHLESQDFERLTKKQSKILTNAAQTVRIGGRLIYSTCSLEFEENQAIINNFLAENDDFMQEKINLPEEFLMATGAARTLPQRDDVDGFFVAQLKKKRIKAKG